MDIKPETNDLLDEKSLKVTKIQNIYFKVSLSLLIFSVVLFILGVILMQFENVGESVLALARLGRFLMYYSIVNFFLGLILLIYILIQKKKKQIIVKIFKTILGIIFSPFSSVIYFAATLLLALSRCSS